MISAAGFVSDDDASSVAGGAAAGGVSPVAWSLDSPTAAAAGAGGSGAAAPAAAAAAAAAAPLPAFDGLLECVLELCTPDAPARPLHACVRDACRCAGVFYTSAGGGSTAQLRATVRLAPRAAVAGGGSSTGEEVDALLLGALGAAAHVTAAVVHQPGGAAEALAAGAAAWSPASRAWVVTFRPQLITRNATARLRVDVGGSVVTSRRFEVCTKPSEWLLVEALPYSWNAEALAAALTGGGVPRPCSLEVVSGAASVLAPSHAFAQFGSRTEAGRAAAVLSRALGGAPGAVVSAVLSLSRAARAGPSLAALPLVPLEVRTAPSGQQPPRVGGAAAWCDEGRGRSSKRSRAVEEEAGSGGVVMPLPLGKAARLAAPAAAALALDDWEEEGLLGDDEFAPWSPASDATDVVIPVDLDCTSV
jgi:hypothetical protein